MKNELKKIINSFSGNVLGIGVDENLTNIIDKNGKVLNCDILSNETYKNKNGKRKLFGNKSININKIRKKYKKKKIDYIICEYEVIKPYMRKFVKNSVYINKTKLFFYGNVDIDLIKTRYKRYDTKIEIKEYKNNYIVEIDNSNAKNNFIKDFFYLIKDTITGIIEVIGDVLMG